jgi:DMSO/TMAO reductase YedYZ molybdopterin-dependent catalytic subunit
MVFSLLHLFPSMIAALLTIALVFVRKPYHKILGFWMTVFALLGLFGFLTSGYSGLFILNEHSVHAWVGFAALFSSLVLFVYVRMFKIKKHCLLGYIAAMLSAISLIMGIVLMIISIQPVITYGGIQHTALSTLPEIEATEFDGTNLTPLSQQGNNAIKGTQYINKDNYVLRVYGLVYNEINISYDELLNLPAYSEMSYMPCVEGWGFNAKWTGFRVADLLNISRLKPDASYVVFYSADDYSTGLPINYIREKNILMAYGINDVTLPTERGFPFQLVADQKYGYKWAKWITEIEVVNAEKMGYWESRGYSNAADIKT